MKTDFIDEGIVALPHTPLAQNIEERLPTSHRLRIKQNICFSAIVHSCYVHIDGRMLITVQSSVCNCLGRGAVWFRNAKASFLGLALEVRRNVFCFRQAPDEEDYLVLLG